MNGADAMKLRRQTGFSLIELMIAVAIVAIIASVAIPSYRQYVRRAKRADATVALLRLASAQERFYLQNNTYASEALLDDAPPAGLGITGANLRTEREYYTLSLVPAAAGGLQAGYTATATVRAGGDQATDTDCFTFTVNQQGVRTAQKSGGVDNTDRCWR
jgi:type IV pilus assembly protein PilE